MKIPVVVQFEVDSSYGARKQRSLFLVDASEGAKCATPLEYVMTEEELREWSGKVQDARADFQLLQVTGFFAGAVRVRGVLTFRG